VPPAGEILSTANSTEFVHVEPGKHVPVKAAWQSSLARNLWRSFTRHGMPGLLTYFQRRYDRWIALFDTPSTRELERISEIQRSWKWHPKIRVIVDTSMLSNEQAIAASVNSVNRQAYTNFELLISDHLQAQTAGADFVLLLSAGDTLAVDALFLSVLYIQEQPDLVMLFADEDRMDQHGQRSEPIFFPNWDPYYFDTRRQTPAFLLLRIEGIDEFFEERGRAANLFELMTKQASEHSSRVRHVPAILIHTHHQRQLRNIAESDSRDQHYLQASNDLVEPKVSIIVFAGTDPLALGGCVKSLLEETAYKNVELIVADPNRIFNEPAWNAFTGVIGATTAMLVSPKDLDAAAYSFAIMSNRCLAQASGELIAFVDSNVRVIQRDWLSRLASLALKSQSGIVGCSLSRTDKTLHNAGLSLFDRLNSLADRCYQGYPAEFKGHAGELNGTRSVSAVFRCGMVARKSVLERAAGFDEGFYGSGEFNEIELCLKVNRTLGLYILHEGTVQLCYEEADPQWRSRNKEYLKDWTFARYKLLEKYGADVVNDPYFNPNLPIANSQAAPCFPPRWLKPYVLDAVQELRGTTRPLVLRARVSTVHSCDLAVVTMFQNEARYLSEWIEFHNMLGVQKFLLYNNFSEDDFNSVLQKYINNGLVELIDWPLAIDTRELCVRAQLGALRDGIARTSGWSKWVAFIDTDEFLFPLHGDSLTKQLVEMENYPAVCVNWRVFGTSGIDCIPENSLLTEELRRALPAVHPENFHVKTIARPDLIKSCDSPHFFNYGKRMSQVNTDGIEFNGPFAPYPVFDSMQINHYRYRDEQHYRTVKLPRTLARGDVQLDRYYHAANSSTDEAIQRFLPSLRQRLT
jgi:hypothetical protein